MLQTIKGYERGNENRRNEPRRDQIGQALNGRPRALRLADRLHDVRQKGVCADSLGLHENEPVPFTVPPATLLPDVFSTGIASPVIIDSSTELWSFSTTPSTGTLLFRGGPKSMRDSRTFAQDWRYSA